MEGLGFYHSFFLNHPFSPIGVVLPSLPIKKSPFLCKVVFFEPPDLNPAERREATLARISPLVEGSSNGLPFWFMLTPALFQFIVQIIILLLGSI